MPHQCMHCERVYDHEIPPAGCLCGSKAFEYARAGDGYYAHDLFALLGVKQEEMGHLAIPKEGSYEIDLEAQLLRK